MPDPNERATRLVSNRKEFKNCSTVPYDYKRDLKVKVTKRLTARVINRFTKVEKRTLDISVDANYLKMVGAKVSAGFSNTLTWDTSNDTTTVNEEVVEVVEPTSLKIPPRTWMRFDSTATEYISHVPLKVVGILDAQLSSALYISRGPRRGEEWARTDGGLISNAYSDINIRRINSDLVVDVGGVSEKLEVAIYQKELSDADCAVPDINVTVESSKKLDLIEINSNYDNFPPEEDGFKLLKIVNKKEESLDFDVSLETFSDDGDGDVSAIFNLTNNSNCPKHGGTISFDAVVLSNGSLDYRDDYSIWQNEENDDFQLEWERYGFLSEDEELIDIENIDIADSYCQVDE
ncbi:hypothetical protein AltI4_31050 [Alteromonas sp. I4]|nr:hypothetical protein AltI4_31050 [Alteromonas sp. I4]